MGRCLVLSTVVLACGQVLGVVPRLGWLMGRCLVLSTVVLACGQVLGVVPRLG